MDNLIDAHIQLDAQLYEHLVQEARREDTSISEIVKRMIERDGYDKPTDWRDKMKTMETKKSK